ncbi:MAG: helix-turn-helix transcriptional regulator [Sphingomonadales bacterium]|nr:MAG: helix-turn-helix transcriptional regulator [Sphingomonadales bacterium]
MVVPCHALVCPLMLGDMGKRCAGCKYAIFVPFRCCLRVVLESFRAYTCRNGARFVRTDTIVFYRSDACDRLPSRSFDYAMIERLTERERDALRLYSDLNSAKAVAQKLNVSHHTVYQRLGSAKDKLDAPSYMAAARQLVEAERMADPKTFAYEQFGVVPDRNPASRSFVSELPWPFPTPGRPENDLSFGAKLIAIFGLAMFMMAVAALYFLAFGVFSSALARS